MHAIVVEEFGDVSQMKMHQVPVPEIKETQVLIEQYATSVNPSDWKKRKGYFNGKTPFIPGGDAAGIVSKVGEKVTKFKVGDRVMANAAHTYAEFAVAREAVTAHIPDTIPFTEAVGLPLAGQAAYQALFSVGKLKPGERVLIHGGAGGVGILAIQMAKSKGASIVTTASKHNEMFLYSLGVDTVIDYRNEDFEKKVADMDLVLDSVGGSVQEKSMYVLKKGGRLVSLAGTPEEEKVQSAGIRGYGVNMRPTAEGMGYLGTELAAYRLRTFISQVFPFTEQGVQEAHTLSERGHVRGKLIIEIQKE